MLIESQMSMFIVQSGPIKRSLVAFSTRTVADVDDISSLLDSSPTRTTRNLELQLFRPIETLERKMKRDKTNAKLFQVSAENEPSVLTSQRFAFNSLSFLFIANLANDVIVMR